MVLRVSEGDFVPRHLRDVRLSERWFDVSGFVECDCDAILDVWKAYDAFIYHYEVALVSFQALLYRVSRWECDRLRQNVPYVKVHRYNPKHLYPKLNGYGDNGERSLKV